MQQSIRLLYKIAMKQKRSIELSERIIFKSVI